MTKAQLDNIVELDGWVVHSLERVGKFKNGINKSADSFGHGYPFVNLLDVFGKSQIESTVGLGLVESTRVDREMYDLQKGDVLIVRSSVKPSGVGLTTVVMADLADSVFSGFLIRFRSTGKLTTSFKRYCFAEEGFRKKVIAASSVSANTNINQENLKRLVLKYPSDRKEQKAIAKALSDTDALIAALEKLITKKRAIKTATMQQLLTGKIRLPGFGEGKGYKDSELGRIPEDWKLAPLGNLAQIVTGGTPTTRSPEFYGKDIFFVSPADLGKSKYITVAGKSLSLRGVAHSRKVPAGSVLFTCIGSTIGKCGMAETPVCFNQQINAVIADDAYCNNFLYYQLVRAAPRVRQSASEQAVPIVNKTKFSETLLRVPSSLVEQTRIAAVISDFDSEILALEQRAYKCKSIKKAMMQQLLTGRTRLI